MPAESHHVLISPLGRSPGAVSGVYFGLRKRDTPVGEVITVGTSDDDVQKAADYWLEPLFRSETDVAYRPRFITSEELQGGEQDVGPFTALMGLHIQQAREAGHVVHVAVTGGRSGMGALGALAAQLYGADHLWHLWVERAIEEGGSVDRLHPPKDRTNVYLNPTAQGKERKAWELVALPFVDMTPLHGVIREYVRNGVVDPATLPQNVLGALDSEQTEAYLAYRTQLRQVIEQSFDEEELRTLCFDLNVDYDTLPGRGKAAKARELISYFLRREQVQKLAACIQQQRPNASWPWAHGVIPLRHLPLLQGWVQASVGQLAQIFPAGLTMGAADRLVALAADYKRAKTDAQRSDVVVEVVGILQEAGVYDRNVARWVKSFMMQPSTQSHIRRLIEDGRSSSDVPGFWQRVLDWVAQNEDMATVPISVGEFLVKVAGMLVEWQTVS